MRNARDDLRPDAIVAEWMYSVFVCVFFFCKIKSELKE